MSALLFAPADAQREELAGGTPVYITQTHHFGQDALLLAHFSQPHRAQTVCDLGTGCGIIPLRWHDRGHRGPCLAVELAPAASALLQAACQEANIAHITPLTADLRQREPLLAHEQTCDVVCCNPPYFTGGLVSPSPERANARHQRTCTIQQVCMAAARLLKDGGKLCMCQRPEHLPAVLAAMQQHRIQPKRLRFVATRPDKAPWLFLVEGQKNRSPGLLVEPALFTTRADGAPSDEILAIYGKQRKEKTP